MDCLTNALPAVYCRIFFVQYDNPEKLNGNYSLVVRHCLYCEWFYHFCIMDALPAQQ